MKARQIIILLTTAVLLSLALVLPATGQTGVIVNNADAVREAPATLSQGLADSTAGVGPRIVLQSANTVRHISLPTVPSSLQTLLGQVPNRIVFQYANTNRELRLAAVPGAFQVLLAQVGDRIIFQYANTNRQLAFSYPMTLIGDTTAPQISGVTASAALDRVTVAWTTDEYATSTVAYGTQRGIYPHTASDMLYARQHEMVLTDLPSGTVYYFKVRSVDRSGNAAESAEYHFRTTYPVYLPTILRRR